MHICSRTLLVCALAATACAADPARAVPLAKTWSFRLDKADEGRKAGWQQPGVDAKGWVDIRVPGAWETQGYDYNGVAWYRTKINVPAAWKDQPVYLQLPVIDESDETWVGGVKVGAMSKNWTEVRSYRIPPEAITWDGSTEVVVRVTDNYGNGGMTRGVARLFTSGDLGEQPRRSQPPLTEPLELPITDGIADLIDPVGAPAKQIKGWHSSLRDGGTGDTRPRLHARPGAWNGRDALGMEVWFPTAAMEFIDMRLPAGKGGDAWADRGANYLAFWYQSDMDGEIELRLSPHGISWQSKSRGWGTEVSVRSGGWKQVIVPFSAFEVREVRKMTKYLDDPSGLNVLSIGYRNNCLQKPGEIRFAGFRVGALATPPALEPIMLDGLWRFKTIDPPPAPIDGAAAPAVIEPPSDAWAATGLDDRDWAWIQTGKTWESQIRELSKFDGIGWYRQGIAIPAEWAGLPIQLDLGTLADLRDAAEVFWNGVKVGGNPPKDSTLRVTVPAELVRAGRRNVVAVRYIDGVIPNQKGGGGAGGLCDGVFMAQALACGVRIRARGAGPEVAGTLPGDTEMGDALGKPFELVLTLAPPLVRVPGMQVAVEVVDIFHHRLALTTVPVTGTAERPIAVVPLSDEASRQLVLSERVEVLAQLQTADGTPTAAFHIPEQQMGYKARDVRSLPPLPETFEDTAYGKLRLLDVIDCAADPAAGMHPYKQGGISQSWVGRRAYSTLEQGVTVGEYQGRRYREANNNEWFSYRIGRGGMKPGSRYILRVVYPEDKTRYQVMNIEAGRNYQGTGFATGVAPGDPFSPYPLTPGYHAYDHFVVNDAVTYGSKGTGALGSRSTDSRHGFWVVFMDNGRCYSPQYQAGPAAAEIRLYEVPEGMDLAPRVAWTPGAPRRTLMTDWEREIEADPTAMVATAKFLGYTSVSPAVLKWGSLAWWRSKLNLRPVSGVREDMPAEGPSPLDTWYDATRTAGMGFIPRFEFGGSDDIPADQRAIDRNGGLAAPNRFHTWCADLLQESTWKEYEAILDEAVGPYAKANPQLNGILWRIRSDRLPISYSRYDIGLYAKDRGITLPDLADNKASAAWANADERKEDYITWWHGKRADFHKRMLAKLRTYDARMQLLYYNWDVDGWSLGGYANKADDWVDYYSRHDAGKWYQRVVEHQQQWKPEDLVTLLLAGAKHKTQNGQPHHALRPELYRDEPGIAVLGPWSLNYNADSKSYWDFWQTKRGVSAAHIGYYEEKGRWNVQNDNYESSEMTPGGPDFAMAEEVLACWHGDPTLLTWTTYTMGRGFVDRHRAFAQAYLALPAIPGTIVDGACTSPEVRVRRYDTGGITTFGVVHRGFTPLETTLVIPGAWPVGARLRDLVQDRVIAEVAADGILRADVTFRPCELRSFRLEMR